MTTTGLTSIILHDSYFRGKRTRINCNGHTNNNGDNGAGKTSALILIPIFYGQEPNKLISRAGNKSNFVEYYLPSNQSLIVYEYSRQQASNIQTYCVCLYRKRNENQYAYRFITGRADDTIFHPDIAHLFTNNDSSHDILREIYVKDGIEVSSQIDNIIDYRDIIQGDYQNLRKRNRKSSFITYPRAYGIAKERVQHLGVLTSVVLRHDKLLAHFKTMLVDCFLRDQISFQQTPIHSKTNDKNSHNNEGLINDLRSLKAFGQHREAIKDANQNAIALLEIWQSLASHSRISKHYIAKVAENRAQLLSLQVSLSEQYHAIRQSFDEQMTTLKTEQSDSEIKLNSKQKHLAELKAQKGNFEQQNIEQKRIDLSNLDEYEQQLKQQLTLIDDLQQSFDKQKRDYDSKRLKLSTELNDTSSRINSQIENIRNHAEEEIRQTELDKDQQQDKNEARLRALNETHQEQLTILQEQARPIELEIELITHKVLSPDEKAHKDQLENELTQVNNQSIQWYSELEILRHELSDLDKQIQLQDKEAQHHEQLAENIKVKIKTLEKQLNPESGSLLSFMKSSTLDQTSGWQQDIAKVIHPELIYRTDLSPQWQDELSSDIYGLALNLEAIETPEFAQNDLALRSRIDAHVLELTEIEERLQDIAQAATALRRQRHSVDAHRSSLNNKLNHSKDTIEAIKRRLGDFEQSCASSRRQHLDVQKTKLSEHKKQVHLLKEKQSQEQQQMITENRQRLESFKDLIATIKQRRDEQVKEKQKLIEDAEKNKRKQEALLQQSYQQALKEEGVDTDTLNEVKSETDRLQARYQTIKAYEALVDKYKRWLKIEWVEAPNYQAQIHDLTDQLISLKDVIETEQKAREHALAEKNRELEQVSKRLNHLSTQQASVETWQTKASPYTSYLRELETVYQQAKLSEQLPALAQLQQHSGLHSNDAKTQNINPAALESEARFSQLTLNLDSDDVPWLTIINKLVPECQQALDKIRKTASTLHNDMTQHLGSQIHQAWQNRQAQYKYLRIAESASTEGHAGETHVLSPEVIALLDVMSLQTVVNEDLLQLEKIIHSSFVTIGLDISNYYGSLNSIKNKISTIGKRLAKDINTQHRFEALSDIRIELNSKIHEYAIWKDLERFDRHYQDWELTRNQLPDESFINSFEQVITSFKQSQIDLNIDSLVEMTIQITENGRQVTIKTDNDLQNASSTGLSMLAVIVVFCGMTRYLCPDDAVTIHWPLDEIGKLSGKNTVLLFDLMKQYNVTLFCAQPDATPALNRFFVNKNLLDLKQGVRQFEVKRSNTPNPLLSLTGTQGSAHYQNALTDTALSSEVNHESNI